MGLKHRSESSEFDGGSEAPPRDVDEAFARRRGDRTARVEEGLDPAIVKLKPRGAAIDHRTQRRPVAFAPGGETQQTAKGVDGHGEGFGQKRLRAQALHR